MKVKTAELTGAALDWAVAKCEGKDAYCEIHAGNILYGQVTSGFVQFSPSTNWAQGGPIIEREEITVERRMPCMKGEQWGAQGWRAMQNFHTGPTPLTAAMRCYVASKLSDEVDVPEELV